MKKAMESTVLDYVGDVLREMSGEVTLQLGFAIGEGTRLDLLANMPEGKVVLVEIKGGKVDDYLPFSVYGQMIVYKKILSEWHGISQQKMVPVVVTTKKVTAELKQICEDAGIIVISIPEPTAGTTKAVKVALQEGFRRIGNRKSASAS